MSDVGTYPIIAINGGTGVKNANTSTITLGGPITFSGAHAFTGTLTGTTGVTFPTSGTLATTSQLPTLPLTVPNGGTGATTLTGLLTGNGTSTVTANAITEYYVLTGGVSNAPNSVAPSATSGVPLISQGSSSQPVFGTVVVAGGGTGDVSFTAYAPLVGGTTTTGALQSADTGISNSGYVLTSTGSSSLPTWQAAGGSGVTTIDGDSGSATGSTITFNAASQAGSSVSFSATGSTVSLNVTDGSLNTMVGAASGNGSLSGGYNTVLGRGNCGSLTTGSGNCVLAYDGMQFVTSGFYNIGIGFEVGVASAGGAGPVSGSNNILMGFKAGGNYTTSEGSNIILNSLGVVGESNVIRIADAGTYAATKCFIGGITGATPTSGNTPQVVLCDNAGNLAVISSSTSGYVLTSNGSATPTFQAASGGGITTIDGDSGSVTGSTVTVGGGTSGLTTSCSGTTLSIGGTLAIANGGTDATSFSTSTGIVKYDGTRLVTSSTAKISSANVQTNTAQPAFYAQNTGGQANVTGDGTRYVILFDSVLFDNASNFTGASGTFTAPVTGNYQFNLNIGLSGLGVAHTTCTMQLVTTGATYIPIECNPGTAGAGAANGLFTVSASLIVPMSATDTANVNIGVYGGTKTVGINGAASAQTCAFSGYLVC